MIRRLWRSVRVYVLLAAVFSVTAQAAVKPDLKAGAWRIAIQMTVPDATGPDTGPAQQDRCLDPDNLEQMLIVPPNAPCTLVRSKLEKNALTWQMRCDQGGFATVADGRISFQNTRLQGRIDTLARGPRTIQIKTRIEGRYLGPCVGATRPAPAPTRPGALPRYQESED